MSYSQVFTLDQIKKNKDSEIRAKGRDLMLQITNPYTLEERDTWPTQVAEAKAYSANNTSPTPMLSAIVTQRGNTLADQVQKILANEAAFKDAVGYVMGIQQKKLDLIAAATIVQEVTSVVW